MNKFMREHLQLLEILICIFFFMAGSVMAGTLFIRSSQIEKANEELQSAVIAAQKSAEALRGNDEISNEVYYFNQEWLTCSAADAAYQIVIQAQSKHTAAIMVYRINNNAADMIYRLEAGGGL